MGYTQQLLFASTAYVRISEIQFCPTEVVVQNKGGFTTYFVILRSEQIPFLMLCASLVCTIRTVSLVKLLGVLIDDNLSFNEHVSKLCVKAARQTNALRRIVKYIPNECRLNIYQAFISSNFNYCDTVWHFCSNRSTYKIEKVHKNALRVTLNNYTSSYSDMLEVVKRPTLYISRIKNIAIETFKSVKGLNPEYMGSLFSFSTTPYCTRGGSKLVQPKVNTISFGINSFAYQGSKIWNNLPQDVKDTTCLIACKDLIDKWEGPTCRCGFCIMCNMSKI